ncbi:hypothetical protein CP03DC29_0364A, partial [Chlamydia psittaci 03DC29]
MCLPIP